MQPPGIGERSGGDGEAFRGKLSVRTRRPPRNPQEEDSVRIIVGQLGAKLRKDWKTQRASAFRWRKELQRTA
jgi:hypothetical protein